MSTRSWILLKNENELKGIYCHFDGYYEHVGRILKEHYNSRSKVESLISLGAISFLEKSIEKPEGHTFDNPIPGYTVAYHRDRGEEFRNVEIHNPYAEYELSKLVKYLKKKADDAGIDFVYVFEIKSEEWISFNRY